MDTFFWQEAVIMSCRLKDLTQFRVLDTTCLGLCDQRFDVFHLRTLRRIVRAWRKSTIKRPRVNSWRRKLVHPDDRYILPF